MDVPKKSKKTLKIVIKKFIKIKKINQGVKGWERICIWINQIIMQSSHLMLDMMMI